VNLEDPHLQKFISTIRKQEMLTKEQKQKQIEGIQIKKIEIRLSLVGKKRGDAMIDCLWPRTTLSSNGKEKTLAFTHWRKLGEIRNARNEMLGIRAKKLHNYREDIADLSKLHLVEDLISMVTGIRSSNMEWTILRVGKDIYRKVQARLGQAVQMKSFRRRYDIYMRKLERAEGKTAIRKLLLSLPVRMEKRDVIEAWQESVMEKIHEA
jgi:hypothetical protein